MSDVEKSKALAKALRGRVTGQKDIFGRGGYVVSNNTTQSKPKEKTAKVLNVNERRMLEET